MKNKTTKQKAAPGRAYTHVKVQGYWLKMASYELYGRGHTLAWFNIEDPKTEFSGYGWTSVDKLKRRV